MNKQHLINKLSERSKMKKVHCENMITDFVNILKEEIQKGNDIKIIGFGTFQKRKRNQRDGRNPHDGSKISIPAAWVAKFQVHEQFKRSLNPEKK